MAIMHPKNVLEFNNSTEKNFYISLKEQLPDEYDVYYSVTWYDKVENKRINSEADFIITHRTKGFLCIEVKGGSNIIHEDDKYKIIDNYGDVIYEKRISPHEQAEKSMRYFYNLYEETYNTKYNRIYGFMAAFPNFLIKQNSNSLFYQVSDTTIDYSDMKNLKKSIDNAFLYFGQNIRISEITTEQDIKKLHDMFKRIYAVEASKGALIEAKEKELEKINEIEDNIINLLVNYKTFAIKGAAGTGKSWIAYKIALSSVTYRNKKVLLISKSNFLSEYFRTQYDISDLNRLDILSYNELLAKLQIKENEININEISAINKYDIIIVDEAQDFNEEEAFFLRNLTLSENSEFYVFYDDEQNIYENELDKTLKNFLIEDPPYILTENLRNTRNIYEWVKLKTKFAKQTFTNQIDGPDPKSLVLSTENQICRYINNTINTLTKKDEVPIQYIKIIIDDEIYDNFSNANWDFKYKTDSYTKDEKYINIMKTSNFKGLESNVIIYVHNYNSNENFSYVGLTRARFYLYDIQLKNDKNNNK